MEPSRGLILGCILVVGGGSVLTSAARSEEAEAIAAAMVEFPGGSGPIQGFLAKPQGDGPFPAVVVIQEWWGLADWIKDNAGRLAEHGYVALAVDLYGGRVTDDRDVAHELSRALDRGEALADLAGGVAYLKSLEFVDRDKPIGAIGWCMGGGLARELAQVSDEIGPTVICYGAVTTESDQIARLRDKPVLGIFGADDRGIPADRVRQFAEALQQAGGEVEIHIYEGAGHAFKRPGGGQYHAEATPDAWAKIFAFFDKHLK